MPRDTAPVVTTRTTEGIAISGPGLFTVSAGDDTHDVAYTDDEYTCRTCGATGLADGHLVDQTGAQAWHDDTAHQPQTGR